MTHELTPRSFWHFPSLFRFPSIWGEDEEVSPLGTSSGLSVSEDNTNVYVEAAVPGIDPKDIEVTYDNGVVWVRGETKKEEKDENKKFYRRASSSFSYRVAIPGDVKPNKEPEAICKNGMIKLTFEKSPTSQPKKITVKSVE